MTRRPRSESDDPRLEALAERLLNAAKRPEPGSAASTPDLAGAPGTVRIDSGTLEAAGLGLQQHVRLRKSVRQKRHQAQLVAAIVTALFAVATGLLGQSSGWAGYNLGVAYGLLIGGAVVAGVAGGIAVYLGIGEPQGLSE